MFKLYEVPPAKPAHMSVWIDEDSGIPRVFLTGHNTWTPYVPQSYESAAFRSETPPSDEDGPLYIWMRPSRPGRINLWVVDRWIEFPLESM